MKIKTNLFRNKKAAEKLLSIWWIFVLAVVGGGIVLGVLIYNSYELDARAIESDILAEKIVDCLVEQGKINEGFLKENFDIFSECGLSKKVLDSDIFYVNITLIDSSGEVLREPIYIGAPSFEKDCGISSIIEASHYPRCSEKKVYILNNKGEKMKLYVLAGSNQHGKRVAV